MCKQNLILSESLSIKKDINLNQNVVILSSDTPIKTLFFAVFRNILTMKREKEKVSKKNLCNRDRVCTGLKTSLIVFKTCFFKFKNERSKSFAFKTKGRMGLNIVIQVLNPMKIFD